MSRTTGNRQHKYQAVVDGRIIDLVIDGGEVSIDDRTMTFSHEMLPGHQISLIIDGRSVPAVVLRERDNSYHVHVRGHEFEVRLKDERDLLLERFGIDEAADSSFREIRAPMPGLVLSIAVEAGQNVQAGSGLLVLEAMKMENELRAPHEGVVKAVHVSPGDAVRKSDLLVEIE